jgi:hypothetical protein
MQETGLKITTALASQREDPSVEDTRSQVAPILKMAATNKCLAQSNKSRTGAKATKRQEKPYGRRHFGRLAKLANGNLWLSLGRDAQATHAIIYLPIQTSAACFGNAGRAI